MKFLKKFSYIFFMFSFIFSFGLVYAEGGKVHIDAPDTHAIGRYYVGERRSLNEFYIEERYLDTKEKANGIIIEKMESGEYLIYSEDCIPMSFSHSIRKIDNDHYQVGIHYSFYSVAPILDITRDSETSNWRIKPLDPIGVICLKSPEVYIEKDEEENTWAIKSALTTPDIKAGEAYNHVIFSEKEDEFTNIINFFAAFSLK